MERAKMNLRRTAQRLNVAYKQAQASPGRVLSCAQWEPCMP